MARAMRTTAFTEPNTISDVLKFEAGDYSREVGTILSGAGVLDVGTVLGQITKGAVTAAAKAGGNTGNGTLTVDATTPKVAGAVAGVYTVRCIAAATNAGTLRVTAPDGTVLGDVAVGATFESQIKFATADGSTDFVVGDGFDVTVAAGSLKYVPHDPTAFDGRETASVVLLGKVDATSADKTAVLLARHAEVSRLGLKWHASVDNSTKKNNAIAQLALKGIITRDSA